LNIKLTVEYAGEDFHGWQVQEGVPTVQGALESAIEIFITSLAKKQGSETPPVLRVNGSGRTDTGVHARGQVANVQWPETLPVELPKLKAALNALTPPGLIVRAVEAAAEDFDARFTPHLKCYTYRLIYRGAEDYASYFTPYERNRVWCLTRPLQISPMIKAARLLEGQHDFQSFRAKDCTAKTTIRTVVRSELVRTGGEELTYIIWGKGFLKQMVRIIVGTLVEIGEEGAEEGKMLDILGALDRSKAGQTAPACGLAMEWVRYSGKNLF